MLRRPLVSAPSTRALLAAALPAALLAACVSPDPLADTADTNPADTAADTDPDDTDPDDTGDCGIVDFRVALEHLLAGTADPCEVNWYVSELDILDRELRGGPWREDLWVLATPDGVTFDVGASERLRVGAAVPEAVLADDGTTWLFYVDGDLEWGKEVARTGSTWFAEHGIVGYGALRAMRKPYGGAWEEVDDFGVTGLVQGFVADPDVIRLPDGRWRMYYVGQDYTTLNALTHEAPLDADTIFYAESDDLVRWTQIGAAMVGPPADPTVVCLDDTLCHLTATGLVWGVSHDGGATFEAAESDQFWGFAPEFLQDGDTIAVYYNGKDQGGTLRRAISEDGGRIWSDAADVVGPCLVEAPSFLPRADGGWDMYYHYWQDGLSGTDFDDPDGPDVCDEIDDPRD